MPFSAPSTIASKATTGNLAQFFIGTVASPMSYNAVAELKSIKPNQVSVPEVEITTLLSPNMTEEMIPGMIKPGSVTIGGNFTGDASQLSLLSLAQSQTVFWWKITAPVNKSTQTYTATGSGYISKYDNGPLEKNKPFEFSAEIQITGSITESVA